MYKSYCIKNKLLYKEINFYIIITKRMFLLVKYMYSAKTIITNKNTILINKVVFL